MRFADYAKLYITSGNGGPGSVHFRREKFIPKGGPDGGDGGRGGDIVLLGNRNMNTLLDLRYKKILRADNGGPGEGGNRSGKNADPVVLEVPLGTVCYEAETRLLIGEVTEDGQELVIAKGGMGGKGNAFFKSDTNQSPRYAQPGESGVERVVEIELKLIADVGLVGYPNAGKSTLLAALSAAKPKIADYPFTTLEPNLGVVSFPDYRSFVMADIPGIIEDAHQGKGLGLRFLRHIERNRMLLLVIACTTDIEAEYQILMNEMREYDPHLLSKPRLVVITQTDLLEGYVLDPEPTLPDPWIAVSSATRHQLDPLKERIWAMLREGHE